MKVLSGRGLIVHDALQIRGGAERVMSLLARELPAQGWLVAAWDRTAFPERTLSAPVTELGVTARLPVWRTIAGQRAFSKQRSARGNYDWAVYSGYNAPLAVHTGLARRSVLYCHALPRFAYDLHGYYLDRLPMWQRPAFRALASWVRPRFEAALSSMDEVVVNSRNVAKRLALYLGRTARVIHPPVDAARFRWRTDGGYFLSTARLEPYKRVDRLIEAFKTLPEQRLVVTSDGSQRAALQELADGASNIRFTGAVSDSALERWIGGARATIYIPRDEDFGLSPLESMAAGKPVVGVAEGGLVETVLPGETGWLLPPDPSPSQIRAAIDAVDPELAAQMRPNCEAQARRFSEERFLNAMRRVVAGEAL